MKIQLTILLSFCLTNIFGQNASDNKYRLAESVFKTMYKRNSYQNFDGKIENIGGNFYKFGSKILKVAIDDTTLLEIFANGIFNPDIIFGKETTHKEKSELDTLSQDKKAFYNLTRNDSLAICCFEQLDKLNPNAQTKRFKFWVIRIGIANPTEYYIELYNDKAIQSTTLRDFLANSIMTFYYRGTLII